MRNFEQLKMDSNIPALPHISGSLGRHLLGATFLTDLAQKLSPFGRSLMSPLTALKAARSRVYSVAALRLVNEPISGVQNPGSTVRHVQQARWPV